MNREFYFGFGENIVKTIAKWTLVLKDASAIVIT